MNYQEVEQGSRALFVVGAVGCIVNTLAIIGLLFTGLVGYMHIDLIYIMSYTLLVIGLILASVGYLGIRRNYASGVSMAGFAVGIVASILFLLWAVLEIMNYLFGINVWWTLAEIISYMGYWQISSYVLSTIYDIFFVLLILWGVAHITTRRLTGKSGLSMATGIMLILTAVFLTIWNVVWVLYIPYWGYWGYIDYSLYLDILELIWTSLFFISQILATILFFMLKVPSSPAKQAT